MMIFDPATPIDEGAPPGAGPMLERVAAQHGAPVTVVDARPGPVVTTYSVVPGRGVSPRKIETLVDSWSLGAGVEVRYVGPRAGAILVEVPNVDRRLVRLADVFDPDDYGPTDELVLSFGWGADGNPVRHPLSRLPHLLVGGATGQGKSAFLNAVLVELLAQAGPDRLRLALVDPKRVELAPYAPLPHLDLPPATDQDAAVEVLRHAEATMDARYAAMQAAGVRHYTDLVPAPPPLVVVVDELADLMLQAKKQVEPLVVRVAQLGRAAGVHLIVGTQRPSVDVVTGLIKANMPTRVAFRTTSMTDSRVLLDRNGAERLVGAGDGLLQLNGATTLRRFQAPLPSEDEIVRAIAAHVVAAPDRPAAAPPAPREDEAAVTAAAEAAQAARAALAAAAPPASADPAPSLEDQIRAERLALLRLRVPQLEERVQALEDAYATLAEVVGQALGLEVPPLWQP